MIFVRFVVNFLFLQGIAAGQIILSAILNLEAEGDIFPFSFFLFPSCPGGFPPQHEKPRLKMKQEKGKMRNSNSD
jgi:hypothetical protein